VFALLLVPVVVVLGGGGGGTTKAIVGVRRQEGPPRNKVQLVTAKKEPSSALAPDILLIMVDFSSVLYVCIYVSYSYCFVYEYK